MTRIVLIHNLAQFEQEVPPPAVVRLSLVEGAKSHEYTGGLHIPVLTVHLNLQGINGLDEIVWLHYNHELQRFPGDRAFWREGDQAIYDQLPLMRDLVKDHLVGLGYYVRSGQYGLRADVKPVRSIFECVQWCKDDQGIYQVEPVASPPSGGPGGPNQTTSGEPGTGGKGEDQ